MIDEFQTDIESPIPPSESVATPLPIDDSADKATREALYLKRGWYTTKPQLKYGVKDYREDDGGTRRVAAFFGQVENDQGESDYLRFGISPQSRPDKFKGKPDLKSELWLRARDAFKAANGHDPQTDLEVYEFIANYPVQVNVVPATRGNLVVGLRAVRG